VSEPTPADARDIGYPHHPISDEQAALLAKLAAGKMVLEIGTGSGVSTRALASSARQVATFDIAEKVRNLIWPELPSNAIPFDRRHEPLRQGGFNFNLVFIDGDHSEDGVRADILEAWPLMRKDALWVFHDMQQEASIRAVTSGPLHFMVNQKLRSEHNTSYSEMWVCAVGQAIRYPV
jgi:predicted O-methyltransferase YrrM